MRKELCWFSVHIPEYQNIKKVTTVHVDKKCKYKYTHGYLSSPDVPINIINLHSNGCIWYNTLTTLRAIFFFEDRLIAFNLLFILKICSSLNTPLGLKSFEIFASFYVNRCRIQSLLEYRAASLMSRHFKIELNVGKGEKKL